MDFLGVLVIIGIVALSGFVIFLMMRAQQFSQQLAAAETKISQETTARETSIKTVVDDVNAANKITNQNIDNVTNELKPHFYFSSNIPVSYTRTSNVFSFSNLPGTAPPNTYLMSQMNALMGITAKELTPQEPIKFCSKTKPSQCILFPDENGRTSISALDGNYIMMRNNVVFPGGTVLKDDSYNMRMGSSRGFNFYVNDKLPLIMSKSGTVGINTTAPIASFHAKGYSNLDPMLVQNHEGTSIFRMSSNGDIVSKGSIQLGSGSPVKCFASGKVDSGVVSGGKSVSIAINFPSTLSDVPNVMITPEEVTGGNHLVHFIAKNSTTTSGFTLTASNVGVNDAQSMYHWFAVCAN